MLYGIDKDGSVVAKKTQESKTAQKSATISFAKNDATLRQLGSFAKQVVDQLNRDNIPATPENYAIYFEKLLDEKPLRQKQSILKILEAEHLEENIYVAQMESTIKESFRQIKVILETVSNMYNRIGKLKQLTRQKKDELGNGSGKIALVAYEESLEEAVDVLEKQQKTLKEHYSEIAENIKNFHANTIFDHAYDVYNKNYLFKSIEREKKNIASFGHESCMVAFKVDPAALQNIKLNRDRELVIKNIAKMILRRSRRNDIVAHLGNDVFVILLKHTTEEQAERVIDSIDQMISYTNFIVESQNIEVSLQYALTKIVPHETREQMLSKLINQLH